MNEIMKTKLIKPEKCEQIPFNIIAFGECLQAIPVSNKSVQQVIIPRLRQTVLYYSQAGSIRHDFQVCLVKRL